MRALHIAEHGDIVIRTQGKAPIELGPGELVLLPHGHAHTIENAMPMPPKNETCWLFGTFTLDDVAAQRLLSVLPDFVELRATQGTPVEWLDVSSRLLGAEVDDPKPGSSVMVSRILDLLFVQILRAWARADGSNGGWLTAAMDPRIGQALEAVHNDPSRNWTIDVTGDAVHPVEIVFCGALLATGRPDARRLHHRAPTRPCRRTTRANHRAGRNHCDNCRLRIRCSVQPRLPSTIRRLAVELAKSPTPTITDVRLQRLRLRPGSADENCNAEVHHRALHVIGARDHNHAGRASIGENPRRVDRILDCRPRSSLFGDPARVDAVGNEPFAHCPGFRYSGLRSPTACDDRETAGTDGPAGAPPEAGRPTSDASCRRRRGRHPRRRCSCPRG